MATIFGALPNILQNGTLADAAQVMADFNKIISDGNANAAENGANASITSLTGLTSPISQAAGASSHFIGASSGGTATALTVASTTPSNWSLTTGNILSFNATTAGASGGTTLAVNGGSALAVRKPGISGPIAVSGFEWTAGQNLTVVYDGTAYLLLSWAQSPGSGFGVEGTVASAATIQLGAVGVGINGHNLQVTGTTTISSLGNSADVNLPIYVLRFAGILTLTNSASLLIPGGANITTAANDWCIVEYLGSGNWIVVSYNKASGQPVVTTPATTGVLVGIQAFTANGTYTPNAAATKAFAILTGGGGAGGGAASAAGGGGGGGGGATNIVFISSPTTQTVTIGPGGTGVSGAGGNAGGTTSLGAITAGGGGGGAAGSASGGAGGTGSSTAAGSTLTSPGSNGGGSAPNSAIAIGGGTLWGSGAPAVGTTNPGVAATAFGTGGSGGFNAASNNAGGAGAAGVIIVFEFK